MNDRLTYEEIERLRRLVIQKIKKFKQPLSPTLQRRLRAYQVILQKITM